jgi:uncharacterized protein with GYD domain
MAQYVALLNFTPEGVKALKSSAQMSKQAEDAVAAAGGRVIWQGLTMGQYDVVAVVELPGDEQALAVAIGQAMGGYVRSQTLKAFSPQEVEAIVARMPQAG